MIQLTGNASAQIIQDFKSAYGIDSSHSLIAEFNMNSFFNIKDFGVYYNNGTKSSGALDYNKYESTDENGQNESYFWDINPARLIHGNLSNVFLPNRPSLNLLRSIYANTKLPNTIIKDVADIKYNSQNIFLYPYSYKLNDKLDYWSSIRNDNNGTLIGVSDANKLISDSNPYVEYESNFKLNKIVIKTQYYSAYPVQYKIYLNSSIIYQKLSDTQDFLKGNLELYYNYITGSWTQNESEYTYVTDFSPTSNQFVSASSIRIDFIKMSETGEDLQLVEISPRLICDVTDYLININIDSSLAQSELGLPVGGLSNSTGQITLSNTDLYFSDRQEKTILYNLLKPNVKFNFYQVVNKTISGIKYTEKIPLKTLYSNSWSVGNEFTTSVDCEDYFKFFKEKQSPDIIIANQGGVPLSRAVQSILNNIGYNNIFFNSYVPSSSVTSNIEDKKIDFFYTRKEQSVAETLQQLAISTQASIHIDNQNRLNIFSKERMTTAIPTSSVSTTSSLVWWMVADDENITSNDPEYIHLNSAGYISNVIAMTEQKDVTISDVNIQYNAAGIQKETYVPYGNKDIEDIVGNTALGTPILSRDLRYALTPLATMQNSETDGFLLYGILRDDIPESASPIGITNNVLDGITSSFIFAKNEKDAVRQFCKNAYEIPSGLSYITITLDAGSMQIFQSTNSYRGYLEIDSEDIYYNGIVFDYTPYYYSTNTKGKTEKIFIFDKREYQAHVSNMPSGSNFVPVALIVGLEFQLADPVEQSGDNKKYQFKRFGRGYKTFGSKTSMAKHAGITTAKPLNAYNFNITLYDKNKGGFDDKDPIVGYKNTINIKTRISEASTSTSTTTGRETINLYPGFLVVQGITGDRGPQTASIWGQSTSITFIDKIDTYLSGIIYPFKKDNKLRKPDYIGTRMRIVKQNEDGSEVTNTTAGGIFFGFRNGVYIPGKSASTYKGSISSASPTEGYFVEIVDPARTTNLNMAVDENLSNIYLYKVGYDKSASYLSATLLNPKPVRVAIVPATSDYDSATLFPQQEEGEVNTSDLEVYIDGKNIKVYWQNQLAINYTDTQNIKNGGYCGLFARGDSRILFDHILIATDKVKNGVTISEMKKQNTQIIKGLEPSAARISPRLKSAFQSKNKKYYYLYEDFGKGVRQLKKFNFRFDNPAILSKVLDVSNNAYTYSVEDYHSTSYGAEFWVRNLCSDIINLKEGSDFPIMVTGVAITKDSEASNFVSFSDIVSDKESDYMSTGNTFSYRELNKINQLRRLYGDKTVQLSGEFIQSYDDAYDLAEWALAKATGEKSLFGCNIFPNPLLEIGDRVGLVYKSQGISASFNANTIRSFIITKTSYSLDENGPNMSIELRELS